MDAQIALAKAGYRAAGMKIPLADDAPEDFKMGYRNFRVDDYAADPAADVERIHGYMRRDGLLPDRRVREDVPARFTGWAVAGYSLLALVLGLSAQTLIGRVASYAATWGGV